VSSFQKKLAEGAVYVGPTDQVPEHLKPDYVDIEYDEYYNRYCVIQDVSKIT